eukprot:COSAG02_NODE_5405_length_4355_cov_12.651325_3_plen_275_part_00
MIFMAMFVNPGWLLGMYEVPLDDLKNDTKNYISVLFWMQNWALWGIGCTMPTFVVRRDGNQKTKSLLCIANLACLAVFFIVGEWKFYPIWSELGMPDRGAHFNRAITAVLAVAMFLGWKDSGSVKPDLSLLSKPTASASSIALCYHGFLGFLFGAMMLFNMDGLFDQYGFKSDGILSKWVHATFTGLAQALVAIFISSTCMLGADAKATAGLVRSVWFLYFGMFVAGAIGNTINQLYLFPEMPVEGQYFNLVLWFIGMALPQKAMTGALPFLKQ